MSSLGSREKQYLLELARRALSTTAEPLASLGGLPHDPVFAESAGVFVTLRQRGRLRGCIGQIGSGQSLLDTVAHCAKAAALDDPRFDPLRTDELGGIEIEISMLSQLEEISPDRIEVGKHGLMVSRGWQRGVLLPQVAIECSWAAGQFLEETCVKAGLGRNAWREPDTKIQGFTAEVFCESDFPSEQPSGPKGRTKPRYSIST